MKTPITDKTVDEWIVYDEPARIMRKLELDRAELMEALRDAETMTRNLVTDAHNKKPWHPRAASNLRSAADAMQSALSAARANFPD